MDIYASCCRVFAMGGLLQETAYAYGLKAMNLLSANEI
jgi:hypothetical protein